MTPEQWAEIQARDAQLTGLEMIPPEASENIRSFHDRRALIAHVRELEAKSVAHSAGWDLCEKMRREYADSTRMRITALEAQLAEAWGKLNDAWERADDFRKDSIRLHKDKCDCLDREYALASKLQAMRTALEGAVVYLNDCVTTDETRCIEEIKKLNVALEQKT